MKNSSLPQYSEYRIYDVISRLESFRCSIGWGQLNEDLEVAIDCLEHIVKAMKEEESEPEPELNETDTPAHWIVDDHGFGGAYYRCSKCGEGFWDLFKHDPDRCEHCHSIMDMDAIEYKE